MAALQTSSATLTVSTALCPHTYKLSFTGCGHLVDAQPGQFVMLRGHDWGTDPLLGRAFSILAVAPG